MAGRSKASEIKNEVMKLEAKMEAKMGEIDVLSDEERRWNALIAKMNSTAS
jgi:hypothetical protein